MTAYIGNLEKEPETLWGIWFPDLPGCIAAAETSETVLAQVGDAIEQWIECSRRGQQIPPPRSLEGLREMPDVAEALEKGDTPILVTLPEDVLGLAPDTLRAIDAAASKRGVSRLAFVRETMLEKLAG